MRGLNCVSSNGGKMSSTESAEVFSTYTPNVSLNKLNKDLESELLSESNTNRSIWWNVVTDVPLIAFAVIGMMLLQLHIIPGHKAGFFCNDITISYPYEDETVSVRFMIFSTMLLPFILILVIEIIFKEYKNASVLKPSLLLYRNYMFGFLVNGLLVEIMKSISGRPRPTFLDVCEPDAAKMCTGSEFISTFECTTTKYSESFTRDAYRSFPSGHSSFSVHCGLFFAWYLQRRAFDWNNRSMFLVPLLQITCLTFSVVCSLSRVTEHRHHWEDVFAGAVIGVLSALYVVLVLCDNFRDVVISKASRKESNDKRVPSRLADERSHVF